MSTPKFVHLLWSGTQQHSVLPSKCIVTGTIKAGANVGAKWRGKTYSATIVAVGMFFVLYVAHSIIAVYYCR